MAPRWACIILLAAALASLIFGVIGRYMATYSGIKPGDEAELERIAVDFLKATDVPRGLWSESIRIIEVYDHKHGGKVLAVKYVTMNMGHPDFMLEAAEEHTAILTVNGEGQVVSALCLHGQKVWDLINQRWISAADGP